MLKFFVDIIALVKGIWGAISSAIDAYKKAKKEGWIADHETVTGAIRDAKTDEERRVLAKKLADLVRRSP